MEGSGCGQFRRLRRGWVGGKGDTDVIAGASNENSTRNVPSTELTDITTSPPGWWAAMWHVTAVSLNQVWELQRLLPTDVTGLKSDPPKFMPSKKTGKWILPSPLQ